MFTYLIALEAESVHICKQYLNVHMDPLTKWTQKANQDSSGKTLDNLISTQACFTS